MPSRRKLFLFAHWFMDVFGGEVEGDPWRMLRMS